MAPASVPLRALLAASFNAHELRQQAERLAVDDLRTLGSFAAQPHALVQRVSAVALALLLSLSPSHADAGGFMLYVRPWAVLRLELLADSLALWRRLRARARQLETGSWVLAPAQIRFACQGLLRFMVAEPPGSTDRSRRDGELALALTLAPIARVSTIAAALGAWVCLCLHHACEGARGPVAPASPIKITLGQWDSGGQDGGDGLGESVLTLIQSEQQTQSCKIALSTDPLLDESNPAQPLCGAKAFFSRRVALKVGGRYVLFLARVRLQPDSVVGSLFGLDTNWNRGNGGSEAQPTHRLQRAFWISPRPLEIPPPLEGTASTERACNFSLSRLPRAALDSVLVQLALREGMLQLRNAVSVPAEGEAMRGLGGLQSYFIVVSCEPARDEQSPLYQWHISFIGRICFRVDACVADLRAEMVAALARSCSPNNNRSKERRCPWSSFQFVYRGALLPTQLEELTSAAELVPIGMLVLPPTKRRSQHAMSKPKLSVPLHFEREIAAQLLNCGIRSHSQRKMAELNAEAISIQQPINSESAPRQSAASVVVEMLQNWDTVVQLQHLQGDAAVVYQLSPAKKHAKAAAVSKRQSFEAFLASREHDEDCKPKDLPPQLPRKRFHPQTEFLMPLYAIADVVSPSEALLSSPFTQSLDRIKPRTRLALMDAFHIVHVQASSAISQLPSDQLAHEEPLSGYGARCEQTSGHHRIEITFERDASCSCETLRDLRGVYVWQVLSRSRVAESDPQQPGLQQHDPSRGDKWPPRWLCAVYRYVTHPVVECSNTQSYRRFRVGISERYVESVVEATFWSKEVDWRRYLRSTDIQTSLLRKCYELLCHSHPPSVAVDGVKFSKLLRECGVQPTYLTVGDAAYLFASHLAPGSHYEMVFDGFERALDRVAHILYGTEQQQRALSPLRQLCFERLVNAPSLLLIWQDVVNDWRLAEKRRRMQVFAAEYCAATRIRALWKQVATRRLHIQTLERMKAERHTATKIQSVRRMHVARVSFTHLRYTAERAQLRIKARAELRRLRRERVAYVERMRVRLVRWMKARLGVLRAWKQLNARWVARRERIRRKRQRMVAGAVFHLETRGYRLYLFRSEAGYCASALGEDEAGSAPLFELEIVESKRSSSTVITLTQAQVASFVASERARLESSSMGFSSGRRAASIAQLAALECGYHEAMRLSEASCSVKEQPARPNLRSRQPKPRPNAILESIAARMSVVGKKNGPSFFSNPLSTSLGKRLFFGAVRCGELQGDDAVHNPIDRYHVVKLLQRANVVTITVFIPSTATMRRFDVTAAFVYRVLQCMQFRGMSLSPASPSNVQASDQAQWSRQLIPEIDGNTLLELVRILRGPWQLQALRSVTTYLMAYGTEEPSYSMMPEVRAAKKWAQEQQQRRALEQAHARRTERIISVQSRARQLLARRARQQLALSRYRKQFDRLRGRFVYVLAGTDQAEATQYESKPPSLFDCDVPVPADEWEPVVDLATGRVFRYANRYRGLSSRFNDEQAARTIQRWFRRLMWTAIKPWGFRQLIVALHFHRAVEKPSQLQLDTLATSSLAFENAKRYAIQLHTVEHDYKAAFAAYEAILEAKPADAEALACLAVLLVASCRYPAKQTWTRAQQLLQEAETALVEASGSSLQDALVAVEDACFCWSLFLNPRDPEAIVNYAVFLQCVRREMDKAEVLYRRGLDVDPVNERLVENYRRLRTHRAPGGLYASSGPGKVALARAQELSHHGRWREMEDLAAFTESARQFFHCRHSGECSWTLPDDATAAATTRVEETS